MSDKTRAAFDEFFQQNARLEAKAIEFKQRAETAEARAAELTARVGDLEATLQFVDDKLTNLQPHIVQACMPDHAVFIDAYVDPVLERTRQILAGSPAPVGEDVHRERWQTLVSAVAEAWNNRTVPGNDEEACEWARRSILDHASLLEAERAVVVRTVFWHGEGWTFPPDLSKACDALADLRGGGE